MQKSSECCSILLAVLATVFKEELVFRLMEITMSALDRLWKGRFMYIDLACLKKGQIIARKYIGFADRLSVYLGSPGTDFAHYAILAAPTANYNDWYTFNATVRKTVELVPISLYKGQLVRVYAVKDGDIEFACHEAHLLLENHVRYEGLSGWNYILRLFPSLLSYWMLHGPRPIPWNKVPNVDLPDRINCMVLIRRCYPNLIPVHCCASAAALEQAYRDGRLILEQEGIVP